MPSLQGDATFERLCVTIRGDGDVLLSEAIAGMLRGEDEVLAVTDAEGRVVGIVDRADLLHGLTGRPSTPGSIP
jgi:predicted transcriptional regulator